MIPHFADIAMRAVQPVTVDNDAIMGTVFGTLFGILFYLALGLGTTILAEKLFDDVPRYDEHQTIGGIALWPILAARILLKLVAEFGFALFAFLRKVVS